MSKNLIRDAHGDVIPQSKNEDGSFSVLSNGDTTGVDFSKKKLLRDGFGDVIPQQYYDAETGVFVSGVLLENDNSLLEMIGNLTDLQTIDKSSLVSSVNEVKTQANDITTSLKTAAFQTYQKGTFTPTLSKTDVTYGERKGTYIKIGDLVFISIRIRLTAKGTTTAIIGIRNLPFAHDGLTSSVFNVTTRFMTNNNHVKAVPYNTTFDGLRLESVTGSVISSNDITDTTEFMISGCYIV